MNQQAKTKRSFPYVTLVLIVTLALVVLILGYTFVDSFGVFGRLNNAAKSLGKPCLLHIMLILTNTDGFGLDLNKLCKRILKTPCYRDRASLHNVIIREFLGCNL